MSNTPIFNEEHSAFEEPVDKVLATVERPSGIVVYSGRSIPRGPVGDVPALGDIAVSLSRMPRFGGHTRGFWSVLDHTLFMVELARQGNTGAPYLFPIVISDEQRRALMRFALFHDAHESITGDIPSPFKTPDMKYEQHLLDVRLFDRYAVRTVVDDLDLTPLVAKLDYLAMVTEARLVGSPSYDNDSMVRRHFGAYPHGTVVHLLRGLINDGLLGTGPVMLDADDHTGYRQFINHYITLA